MIIIQSENPIGESKVVSMGVSRNGGNPIAGWLILENPISEWMMTRVFYRFFYGPGGLDEDTSQSKEL